MNQERREEIISALNIGEEDVRLLLRQNPQNAISRIAATLGPKFVKQEIKARGRRVAERYTRGADLTQK